MRGTRGDQASQLVDKGGEWQAGDNFRTGRSSHLNYFDLSGQELGSWNKMEEETWQCA